MLKWFKKGNRPNSGDVAILSPATRHYWLQWDSLCLKDGVLHRKFHRKDGTGSHDQFVAPKSMHDEILRHMHDSVLSGHLGRNKSQEKTLQRFYWFNLRKSVERW